jgi:hypothetical protein
MRDGLEERQAEPRTLAIRELPRGREPASLEVSDWERATRALAELGELSTAKLPAA